MIMMTYPSKIHRMQIVLEYFQIPLINQMRQKFLMGKKEKHQ